MPSSPPPRPADILEHFARPVAFHRPLATICGDDLAAGMMLSQAMHLSHYHAGPDGSFWYTNHQWLDACCLTRTKLEAARARLVALGFIVHVVRGLPAKSYYAVDVEAVHAALRKLPRSSRPSACAQVANQSAENPPASEKTSEINEKQTQPAKPVPRIEAAETFEEAEAALHVVKAKAKTEAIAVMVEHGIAHWDSLCILRDPKVRISDDWLLPIVLGVADRYRQYVYKLGLKGERVKKPGGWWRMAMRGHHAHHAGRDRAALDTEADRQRRVAVAVVEADAKRRPSITLALDRRARTSDADAAIKAVKASLTPAVPQRIETVREDTLTVESLRRRRAAIEAQTKRMTEYMPRLC